MRKRKHTSGGYTLIEITLSLLVLSLGLSSILAIFPVGINIAKKTKNNSTGPMACMAVAEQITDAEAALASYTVDDVSGYYFRVIPTEEATEGGKKRYSLAIYFYSTESKRTADSSPYSKATGVVHAVVRRN